MPTYGGQAVSGRRVTDEDVAKGFQPRLARRAAAAGTGATRRITGGTEPKRAIIGKADVEKGLLSMLSRKPKAVVRAAGGAADDAANRRFKLTQAANGVKPKPKLAYAMPPAEPVTRDSQISAHWAANQAARRRTVGKADVSKARRKTVFDAEDRRRQRNGVATGVSASGAAALGVSAGKDARNQHRALSANMRQALADRAAKPGISGRDQESIQALLRRGVKVDRNVGLKGGGALALAGLASHLHARSRDPRWT